MTLSLPLSKALSTCLLLSSFLSSTATALTWKNCGPSLDCTTLDVPLEYATTSPTSVVKASIALVRYNATVPQAQRLGSLLTNPGGPGASGVSFVIAGAGPAISALTGGLYDIIGFDPRGVGLSTPTLECFPNAGTEYDFASAFPSAPNLWSGGFSDPANDKQVADAITAYDAEVQKLSEACAAQGSATLLTSSAAYVARDMAAIVDALDGNNAVLNYWGFSYGTIYLSEFIQTFPERVGRVIADGVVNPEANALTYASLLPTDQISVPDAISDFAAQCESSGVNGCPLSVAPASSAGKSLADRMNSLFEATFKKPIIINGLTISMDILSPFLWSFLRVPTTWQTVATAIQALEAGNATAIFSILASTADKAPTNRNAPGVGTLSTYPLQCIDNADSSRTTIGDVIALTKKTSIATKTPLLNADLGPITFCRHYPIARPKVRNSGSALLDETNKILTTAKKSVLIINPIHDPVTPLVSAERLRSGLSTSSVLVLRGGSGHTSVSWASLGIANVISQFFVKGTLPKDLSFYAVDQEIFPAGVADKSLVTPSRYNGTHTKEETALLEAVYGIGVAFLAIA